MCVDTSRVQTTLTSEKQTEKFSTSYSIKKVMKSILKKYKIASATSCDSLESLANLRNSQAEDYSTEIEDNAANERLLENYEQLNNYENEEMEAQQQVFPVPVNCVKTANGTFFWMTTSQSIDADLIQPLQCRSQYQVAELQYHDRWAQA